MGKQELANPRSELIREIKARGSLEQASDLEALDAAFADGMVTFYIGYDPTAPSLHVGHLVPIMAMRLLQRHGHRPICLIGGGTARVGDPSGKTETRKLLSATQISANTAAIKAQLSRFIHFDRGEPNDAIMVDNADWLLELHYIDFLRDIGRHFSVNRMVATKTYRDRLEAEIPLSFLEFNYQLLQSYDFLRLYMDHDCTLQVGGADQWGNMIAGVELIRRVRHASGETKSHKDAGASRSDAAHAMTLPLLTTSDGRKMGKTEKGAVWLEAEQLSPYEYYQFWYNTADADVPKMFRTFTDVPVDEIDTLCAHEGAALSQAKIRLALEATSLLHGDDAAQAARRASEQAFGGSSDWSALPCLELDVAEISLGDLLVHEGIAAFKSKRLARQSVQAGSVKVNDVAVTETNEIFTAKDCGDAGLRLQASKKKRFLVKLRA